MMDDIERQLRAAERPEPRVELRAHVLATVMPLVRPDGSRLDRIWFSRGWRTAAVLALVVLAGLHLAPWSTLDSAPMTQDHPTADAAQSVAMAAREAGLSQADAVALGAQALAAARAMTLTPLDAEGLVRWSNQ
jgi:hypothetical protein